ncbi:MAG TPA: [protein-PII] uridylyltransferase [SAR86 cluster bacterium]|nr:[protein-PII] uridylyltransferase [SAR86 cluster bacterium]
MSNKLSKLKSKNEDELSSQFSSWLHKDRGRHVKGIEYFLNKRSENTDLLILEVAREHKLNQISNLGLFTVGGYGRSELHPHSDIDLLLLSEKTLTKSNQKKVEKFIGHLWDLGLDIGHSVRTTKQGLDQARKDVRTMTNMLEYRKLLGNKEVLNNFLTLLETKNLWRNKKFFEAKLEEQTHRHNRFNNTEYNLEPDIKSSPGGLRDIHTIDWIIKNCQRNNPQERVKLNSILTKEERTELNKSKYWLWTIRYLLHEEAGREEDRLLFEYQISIARKLFPSIKAASSAAEKLMHRYYRSALNISEINSTALQAFQELTYQNKSSRRKIIDDNFYEKNKLINLTNPKGFKIKPSLLLELFIKLSENPHLRGISSETLRLLKRDRNLIDSDFRSKNKNINLFLQLLKSKRLIVTQLESMKELGILGRYLPEFGRVTGQMQYDLFHIYTVDAHTLQVLRNMRRMVLKKSTDIYPLATELIQGIPKIDILYIAGLYHDIGKGRGSDHSNLGKSIVRRFCNRHKFIEEDRKLVEWLVTNHLLMSVTSQKEDLSDPEIISIFAKKVKTKEYLDYLYCLTVADVSATNPSLWNSWNSSLLSELYNKALKYVESKDSVILSLKENKSIALKVLSNNKKIKVTEVRNSWKNFYSDYFESFNSGDLAQHAKYLSKLNSKTLVKLIEKSPDSLSTIMIYTKDRANVFATIVGILDSENINFLDARLFGMKNGYCLDFITISNKYGDALLKGSKIANSLQTRLKEALDQDVLSPKIVQRRQPRRLKHFNTDTVINYKHDMTHRWTEIDIKTSDRPGLLAAICQVFLDHGALIKKARIATYGERAEDRFCISSKENTPYLKKKELQNLIDDMNVSLIGKKDE